MPRKLLIRNDYLPYHVTARTNNRECFPLPMEVVWDILTSELFSISVKFQSEIHAFVLMPNHFHLLLTVPFLDLGRVMNTFMRNVTKDCHEVTERSGRLFGGPYHWSLIDQASYYRGAFKYVYRNPVRARLSARVEDYPYSTYSGLVGRERLPVPIWHPRSGADQLLPGAEPVDWKQWLNTPFQNEMEKHIRFALKRRVFTPPIDRITRKPVEILS